MDGIGEVTKEASGNTSIPQIANTCRPASWPAVSASMFTAVTGAHLGLSLLCQTQEDNQHRTGEGQTTKYLLASVTNSNLPLKGF